MRFKNQNYIIMTLIKILYWDKSFSHFRSEDTGIFIHDLKLYNLKLGLAMKC